MTRAGPLQSDGCGTHLVPVDVAGTLNSGQVFLWSFAGCTNGRKEDGRWYMVDGQRLVRIDDATCRIRACSKGGRWGPDKRDIFRCSDDLKSIEASLQKDEILKNALYRYQGLRIMRQDPYQCMISFIISTNSNIQRIRTNLASIAERFGEPVIVENDRKFHLFPTPARMAEVPVHTVREWCKVGYRAEHVVEASKMVASGEIDFGRIRRMANYEDMLDAILKIPGVGNKVADCMMLFSLDRLDAFPLDRWMMRALYRYYGDVLAAATAATAGKVTATPAATPPPPQTSLTAIQYRTARKRIVEHFGQYAGYAQQLLFKTARDDAGAAWLRKKP